MKKWKTAALIKTIRATHHKNYAAQTIALAPCLDELLSAHALMAINDSSESGREAEVPKYCASMGHEIDDFPERYGLCTS